MHRNTDISFFLSFWSSNDAWSNPWPVDDGRFSAQRRSSGWYSLHHPHRPAQTSRALQPRYGSVSSHPEQTRQETVRRHQGWGENKTWHLTPTNFKGQLLIASGNLKPRLHVNNLYATVWESESKVLLFVTLLCMRFTVWSRLTPSGHNSFCASAYLTLICQTA